MTPASWTSRCRLEVTAPTVGLTLATASLASRIPQRVQHAACTTVHLHRQARAGRPTGMDFLRQWVVGIVALVAIDLVWLGVVANGFYRRELGPLLRMNGDRMDPRLAPAVLFYAIFVAGLILFALPRARAGALVETMAWSGLFGLVATACTT
jgi:uncharacterized membrane protein